MSLQVVRNSWDGLVVHTVASAVASLGAGGLSCVAKVLVIVEPLECGAFEPPGPCYPSLVKGGRYVVQ